VVNELRSRGVDVPREVTENLKIARMILHHYEFDPHTSAKTLAKAHKYLDRAQRSLAELCEEHEDLMEKLSEWVENADELASRFLEDAARSEFSPMRHRPVPRAGDGYARVELPEPVEVERLQDVCEETGAIVTYAGRWTKVEVFGDREAVKRALRSIRELPESWKKLLERRGIPDKSNKS